MLHSLDVVINIRLLVVKFIRDIQQNWNDIVKMSMTHEKMTCINQELYCY